MKTTRSRLLLVTLASLSVPALALADAQANWTKLCARCHAADGSGSTKVGKKLGVKDYTTAEGQKFTDEEALKAIVEGVKDDAGKEKMPGYSEKLSEDDSKALVAFVRGLKK